MKFELFGRLKKHSAPEPAHQQMREIPYERVEHLAAQGIPEADIIKNLKDAGYSFREIDEALNGAVKAGIGADAPPVPAERHLNPEVPSPTANNFDLLTPEPDPDSPGVDDASEAARAVNAEELEEIINTIADEKMSDIKSSVERSELAVKDILEKLKGVNAGLDSAKSRENESNAEAERKIGELRAKLDELEPKILGLERAFKDIMPNLVDSVREVKEAMHAMKKVSGHNRVENDDAEEFGDEIEPKENSEASEIRKRESVSENSRRHDFPERDGDAKPAFRLPRQKSAKAI